MITDISALVPMCKNVSHRLDKLSVLELAVQHMRMITNSVKDPSDSIYKPSMLTEDEMKYFLERKRNGFLLVMSCDKAQILYVSDSVSNSTCHTPAELVGRSLLDIANPKDVSTITDMLSPYPSLPLVGSKLTNQCTSGAKRSFSFRLKSSKQTRFEPSLASNSNRYQHSIPGNSTVSIHCEGFLKSWQTSDETKDDDAFEKIKLSTFSCFIGVAQPIVDKNHGMGCYTDSLQSTQQHYLSRHTADGTYVAVDQRVLPISGYLPQDLIGYSEYKFIHQDDIKALSETYRLALESKDQEKIISDIYRLKLKHGGLLSMRTVAFSLFNPFTKELEFVSHQNFVMGNHEKETDSKQQSPKSALTQFKRYTSLKEKCESVAILHGTKDDEAPQIRRVVESSMVAPLTLNVLRKNGVDTDMISCILNRHKQRNDVCDDDDDGDSVEADGGESSINCSKSNRLSNRFTSQNTELNIIELKNVNSSELVEAEYCSSGYCSNG